MIVRAYDRRVAGADRDEILAALRARVYGPHATEADRLRYRAAVDAAAASPAAEGAPGGGAEPAADSDPADGPLVPIPSTRRGRGLPRRRAALITAGVAVLAAVTAVAVETTRTSETGLVQPSPVTSDGESQLEFEQALGTGGDAGIAAYLVTHRSPPALRSATRFTTVELHGVGDAIRTLRPPAIGATAGRATVFFVQSTDSVASWRVLASLASTQGDADSPVLAARGGLQDAGVLTSATIRYPSGRMPVQLRVTVPDGVRWGAAVVYSD